MNEEVQSRYSSNEAIDDAKVGGEEAE